MSNSTSTGWSSETQNGSRSHLRRVGRLLLKGLCVGLLAGMAAFVYNMTQFVAADVSNQHLLVPVLAAGAFGHLFAASLPESIRLGIVGFFVGLFVYLTAWIAPLWILSYPPALVDAMLPRMAGQAMSAAFLNYATAYLGGYLITVSISAIWE